VSKLEEPARLFDPASPTTDGVRRVLRSGQRGLPGPDELARLAARLPLGPLPPPSGSTPTPKASPPRPSLPRLPAAAVPSALPGALVGVVLALGVVAGMAWRDSASSPTATLPGASMATTTAAPMAAPRLVDPPASAAPSEAPGPARVQPSTASSIVRADGPPGDPPSLAESGSPAPAAAPDVAADTETEAHLLQRAQSALGADPGGALALAGDHARRFPGGSLGQERELIAVTALVALGRRPEAQARAAALLERFPGSAYRGRLESLGLGK
jgi:hypothetical protein